MLDFELAGPLYKASDSELKDVVNHLTEQRYEDRERNIQKIVDQAHSAWLEQQRHGYNSTFPRFAWTRSSHVPYSGSFPPMQNATMLTAELPPWVPPEYAKLLLDQMIREQIKEFDR